MRVVEVAELAGAKPVLNYLVGMAATHALVGKWALAHVGLAVGVARVREQLRGHTSDHG